MLYHRKRFFDYLAKRIIQDCFHILDKIIFHEIPQILYFFKSHWFQNKYILVFIFIGNHLCNHNSNISQFCIVCGLLGGGKCDHNGQTFSIIRKREIANQGRWLLSFSCKYTGMKKKQLLPNKHSYKYLSRKAVLYIVSFDKYNDFIIDTELEIVYQYSNMRKKGIQLKKSRCSFGSVDWHMFHNIDCLLCL